MDTTARTPLPPRQQVVVIGSGQAGLATAAALGRRGIAATVLDAGPEVGHVWRRRWDGLRLFTPARSSSLPGLPFPGDPDRYPTKDEVADYLHTFAATERIDVRCRVLVEKLGAVRDGFELVTSNGPIRADHVVIATGPFQTPVVPSLARRLGEEVDQVHSADYRDPASVRGPEVLVVGGGNSGFQIAAELAANHRVELAVGTPARHLPQRVLGRDLFWWLDRTGLLEASAGSAIGGRLRRRQLLIGSSPRAVRRLGVTVRPRVVDAHGTTVRFADGARGRPGTVIWATGYRRDHGFVDIPDIRDRAGVLLQHGVRTLFPGLYAVGQPWQRDRGSALLGFVGREAIEVAELIATSSSPTGSRPRSSTPTVTQVA
jgi:putative flavoprotein involved in K+ transport